MTSPTPPPPPAAARPAAPRPPASSTTASAAALEKALAAAALAAGPVGAAAPTERARMLRAVAGALEAAADTLVPLAIRETRLAEARLRGELVRTTFQLRLFADLLDDGGYLAVMIDMPDPGWPTGPRPDLRRLLVPVGPVLVFAASNFPFAFGVAGGDTAAALAAGCPVLLKAHPGQPELSRQVAALVTAALAAAGAPAGAFALVEGDEAGRAALVDPRVRAGAFTGSARVGRLLFDLAASRPDPIPFHGELGSTNPVFVTPAAAAARGGEIWAGFAGSFTLGAGQFCTKPGLLVAPAGAAEQALAAAVAGVPGAAMLNDRIEHSFRAGLRALATHPAVTALVAGTGLAAATAGVSEDEPGRAGGSAAGTGGSAAGTGAGAPAPVLVTPSLVATTAASVLADPEALAGEVFGPVSVLVTYTEPAELLAVARALGGQLTATVHAEESDPADASLAGELLRELAGSAGRIVWNGWPTGVSVSPAMTHGGPYPAATTPATSVGTTAIGRFLRPVTYQDVPDALLPAPVRAANPWTVPRLVDHGLTGSGPAGA